MTTSVERADDRIIRIPLESHTEPASSQFEIREWPWDASELDDIWKQQKDTIRIGLVRDRTYLTWR